MRSHSTLVPATALALAVATIGCSAVDDFGRFRFVSDGSSDGMMTLDGGASDLAGTPGEVGAACTTTSCAVGLTCFTMAGNQTLQGGFCSRTCDPNVAVGCPPGSECGTVEGFSLCLPRCDASQGIACRPSYSCCHSQMIVQGPGACAPTGSNFCGN